MSLGENIYQLRKKKNISQEQLGEQIGVTRQTISHWELEETAPNPEQLKRLSGAFGVSIDCLLDNEVFSVQRVQIRIGQWIKKYWLIGLVFIAILTACIWVSNIKIVRNIEFDSKIYTDEEITAAIDATMEYFREEFTGCVMKDIGYAGDETLDEYQEYVERNNAKEVIVLVSNFEVKESADGSLNSNSIYKNWNWILVREKNGEWEVVDYGY